MSAIERTQCGLSQEEIVRYGRQLILPFFGSPGQEKLKAAKVLVIGAGGLGCSLLVHLGCMGVGMLGIVDGDVVDGSNLHRQLLYTVADIGKSKADCARVAVLARNPTIRCEAICEHLTPSNADRLVKDYDLVVDCTDNMPTRYLINDAAVLNGKAVVSGSALGMEGQVSTYGARFEDGKRGPCYRCLFPETPSPRHVGNCNNGGVLGVIPGIIGSLQALEVVKILIGAREGLAGSLLLLDGEASRFQAVNMISRRADCRVCGDHPTITTVSTSEPSYFPLCSKQTLEVTSCSPTDYQRVVESVRPHLLVDVRNPTQFKVCSLKHAVNIPLAQLPAKNWAALSTAVASQRGVQASSGEDTSTTTTNTTTTTTTDNNNNDNDSNEQQQSSPAKKRCLEAIDVYVICRRGVDSVTATKKIEDFVRQDSLSGVGSVINVAGGYVEWAKQVDSSFPIY